MHATLTINQHIKQSHNGILNAHAHKQIANAKPN